MLTAKTASDLDNTLVSSTVEVMMSLIVTGAALKDWKGKAASLPDASESDAILGMHITVR